jgi:hypothetical protein
VFDLFIMSGKGQGQQTGQQQGGTSQSERDYHANQMNPNNPAFQQTKDNRADQMNPNNPAYESSRTGAGQQK